MILLNYLTKCNYFWSNELVKLIYHNITTTMRNHMKSKHSRLRKDSCPSLHSRLQVSAAVLRLSREESLSDSEMIYKVIYTYKVSSRESGLTQSAKKLLAHVIFVSGLSAFLFLSDWGKNFHQSMWILLFLMNTWNNLNNKYRLTRVYVAYILYCNWHSLLAFSICSAWSWMLFFLNVFFVVVVVVVVYTCFQPK